jgi:hypothetical protein
VLRCAPAAVRIHHERIIKRAHVSLYNSHLDAASASTRHPRHQCALLAVATDLSRHPQQRSRGTDTDGRAQQAVVAVRRGGRRVLLCVRIAPGEAPASALLRAAAAAGVPVGLTPGGLLNWTLSAVRHGGGEMLDSRGAEVAACCGRLLGGMPAATGGLSVAMAATAACEGSSALATARQTRSRLAACISSVRGLQGLVDRLGRDLLQAEGAGGHRLPAGGEVDATRTRQWGEEAGQQQGGITRTDRTTQTRVEARGEAGGAEAALRLGGVQRRAEGVSISAQDKPAQGFDEAADDDELLQRVFNKMDTNNDNYISREELDTALKSWTGSKELVEALQGAILGGGAGMKYEQFKKIAEQVHLVRTVHERRRGHGDSEGKTTESRCISVEQT